MRPLLLFVLAARALAAQNGAPDRPPLTPALIRADLAVLREQVIGRDASYTTESRGAALARVDRLDNAADTLHRAYLELEIGRIAALADRKSVV